MIVRPLQCLPPNHFSDGFGLCWALTRGSAIRQDKGEDPEHQCLMQPISLNHTLTLIMSHTQSFFPFHRIPHLQKQNSQAGERPVAEDLRAEPSWNEPLHRCPASQTTKDGPDLVTASNQKATSDFRPQQWNPQFGVRWVPCHALMGDAGTRASERMKVCHATSSQRDSKCHPLPRNATSASLPKGGMGHAAKGRPTSPPDPSHTVPPSVPCHPPIGKPRAWGNTPVGKGSGGQGRVRV